MRADAVERRTLLGRRSAEANYAGGSGTMQLAGIEGQLGTRERDGSTSVLHASIACATGAHLTTPIERWSVATGHQRPIRRMPRQRTRYEPGGSRPFQRKSRLVEAFRTDRSSFAPGEKGGCRAVR